MSDRVPRPDLKEIRRIGYKFDRGPERLSAEVADYALQLEADRDKLLLLVDRQANDSGLWFSAKTAAEAYLQQELRALHAAIEEP